MRRRSFLQGAPTEPWGEVYQELDDLNCYVRYRWSARSMRFHLQGDMHMRWTWNSACGSRWPLSGPDAPAPRPYIPTLAEHAICGRCLARLRRRFKPMEAEFCRALPTPKSAWEGYCASA